MTRVIAVVAPSISYRQGVDTSTNLAAHGHCVLGIDELVFRCGSVVDIPGKRTKKNHKPGASDQSLRALHQLRAT